MAHIIAALFFSGILVGLALLMQFTLRDYWADIVAALSGELPPRRQVRAKARPAASQQRVAA